MVSNWVTLVSKVDSVGSWYGLVKILKLNSRPLINFKGGYRAARAAKKLVFFFDKE